MLFIDPFFLLVFAPATLILFWFGARNFGPTGGLTVTLIASCSFYIKFGVGFAALLIASVIVNFIVGICLATWTNAKPQMRLALLVAGQVFNFGNLIYFKYLAPLIVPSEGQGGLGLLDAAIPVGISFYTFHQAVFLADAYALKPEVLDYLGRVRTVGDTLRAALRYGAFILFFPQLVIGPIVYLSEFAKSTQSPGFGRFRRTDVEVGVTLIAIGLFKKIVIADQLAAISAPAFATLQVGQLLDPAAAWMAVLAYYCQLYFDFSGYSDIAIGLARLFGVRFPMNFDSPLRSAGIVDFYKRWHITLTRVISRFLFTPLSAIGIRFALDIGARGAAQKLFALWIPLLLNFQIIGLWHGASATFFAFGLIHGLWFITESNISTSKRWRNYKKTLNSNHIQYVGQALTFLPLMLTFALFASPDLSSFGRLLESLWQIPRVSSFAAFVAKNKVASAALAAAYAVVWMLPNSNELLRAYRPSIKTWFNASTTPILGLFKWRPSPAWAAVWVILIGFSLWFHKADAPFLYQGF